MKGWIGHCFRALVWALFGLYFGLYQGSTRPPKVSALQVPSKTRPNVQNREIPDAQVSGAVKKFFEFT